MKRKLLLLLAVFLTVTAQAQVQISKGSYYFNTDIIDDFTTAKVKGTGINNEIVQGRKLTVVGQSTDLKTTYFKYWYFGDDTIKNKNATYIENAKLNGKVFEIPSSDFSLITNSLYSRYKGVNVGVYTIPFRLRGIGNDFDFESSLSLQANLVAGFGSQKSETSLIDASVGIGLTGVSLSPKNSNVVEERTASALTISTGVVIKPSKVANIGLFIGWDSLGAKDKDVRWIYNGKTWVGIGINISFNNIITTDSAKDPHEG